ncbi:DUF5684 domain-containing protein [Herbiconiux sp.]|uniref:DUF5684 domain-containing protein n=1 Tax=Herbiconiux sp. TaxID=1871186 RepID=UPI0025BBCF3F|nr:DUF5684 domain-containing protein [Herbiconiux sp.]
MSSDETAQFLAIYLTVMVGTILLTLLIVAALWVLMGFALMALFRKVGIKPWVAWVPVYRTWVWLELGGQPGWLSLLSIAGLGTVTSVFLYIGMWRTGLAFRKDAGFLVIGIFFPYVWAFMLGGRTAVYEPQLLAWHRQPPPRAGYGSYLPNPANAF